MKFHLHNVTGDQPNPSMATRRQVLGAIVATGLGSAAFQRAVAQDAATTGKVTEESIHDAQWVAGIELTQDQRQQAVAAVQGILKQRKQLRQAEVDYETLPALRFDPEIADKDSKRRSLQKPKWLQPTINTKPALPDPKGNFSFLSIHQLGMLLRQGSTTSVELTNFFLEQLRNQDPVLKCVVTWTDQLALRQAKRADQELAQGKDRGPLHGIPWGAKDLIAVEGYPTTWGAPQFRNRLLPNSATVAKKLEDAGAVLVAKLSMGALAMGDRWFGGQTRNPWNTNRGSSGSSAGPASAVAAGLVPFALGTETMGSIISPSRRCGITALRPTFGRISRSHCMSLSWSMDKLGPMARTIDDCGLVLRAVHGDDDGGDPSAVSRWFQWPMEVDLSRLRIGEIEGAPISIADSITLKILKKMGAQIISVKLPHNLPTRAIGVMLDTEAATMFHPLVANHETEGLNRWPAIFRNIHFLPAVDYLHAARLRVRLMEQMADLFQKVDLYVGGNDLGICNLTGHPTIVFPTTISKNKEHPQPICSTLTGRLYDEATLLSVARLIETKVAMTKMTPNRIPPTTPPTPTLPSSTSQP